jgi:hypothetical protein
MKSTVKRFAAVAAAGAASALVPVAGASAAPIPAVLPHLPPFAFPAGAFTPAGLVFMGPRVAIGPTVIGSVFNGGTAVVVSNDPPVASGNVIGSP